MKTQKGWIIISVYGAYTGWDFTKRDIIKKHCRDLESTWELCKKRGDKAVKCTITYKP